MINSIKVLQFLQHNRPNWFDDDDLSDHTQVRPRQQINQICTRLYKEGLIDRMKIGGKLKNRSREGREAHALTNPPVMQERSVKVPARTSMVETWDEAAFQNGLFQALRQKIGQHDEPLRESSQRFMLSGRYGPGWAEMEGELQLGRVSGTHKADILITNGTQKLLAIEIKKFGSSVTDVFKSRSYDAYHTKLAYGERLDNVLVYFHKQKTKSTISIERAKALSYWYDFFIGIDVEVERDELWHEPVKTIETILASWNSGSEVNR